MVENPKALSDALNGCGVIDKAIARSRNSTTASNHSNRRERLYDQAACRLHARIVNVRNDHHHKATTAIAKMCRG